jgi:hypothetical protein
VVIGGAQVVTSWDIGSTALGTDHVTFLRMANETPQAALDEFVRAVRTPVEGGRADPNVAAAFAAGWHAADARSSAADVDRHPTDDDAKRTLELARSMLKADVARLKEHLAAAEQPVDEVSKQIDRLEGDTGRLAAAEEIDRRLAAQLMAADFRLGKAFMIACKIARLREFARPATFDRHEFAKALLAEHDDLQRWLQQLATALPPNAAHSVRDSLNMWANAVTTNEDRPKPLPADDLTGLLPEHVHRQVEAWRMLLSGEKAGRDTLELPDYVGVAEGVANELRVVIRRGLKRFWWLLGIALALLALGIALILLQVSGGIEAGLATVVASLGLTWKGLGSSLGRAVAKVEQPAWSAQVDRAIAFSITVALPDPLIKNASDKSLLKELEKWRKDNTRPTDQGRRLTS